jgi:transcriptional regulator of arginine metabolism
MENKFHRLQAIRQIIQEEKISSQEELLQRLSHEGYDLTQATVSRDLKFLQVGKKPDPEKGSVFFLPDKLQDPDEHGSIDSRLLMAGIRAIYFANLFGIVKTLPGHASSIAVHIDKTNRFEIIGTIAGDDTILLIPGQDINHTALKKAMLAVFPDLDVEIFRER